MNRARNASDGSPSASREGILQEWQGTRRRAMILLGPVDGSPRVRSSARFNGLSFRSGFQSTAAAATDARAKPQIPAHGNDRSPTGLSSQRVCSDSHPQGRIPQPAPRNLLTKMELRVRVDAPPLFGMPFRPEAADQDRAAEN